MTADSAAEFDKIAREYDESRGGSARAEGFAAQLAPLLDARRALLDVGVGTGIVAAELARCGIPTLGVDLAPAMLSLARHRLGARVAVADAARLPVRSASVAQAVSTWLLHVVPDRTAVFAEVARVLEPGGRYYVIPARGQRPTDDIGAVVNELEDLLDPARTRQDGPEVLAPAAESCGLRFLGPFGQRAKVFEESPQDMAEALSTGLFSGAWTGGAQAAEATERACAKLRALPEPARPRAREVIDAVLVFERPPGR
ncbi:Methyltransferase domain-containing protein [Actinacidiphila yanglinensis]|uniref:Methyltransferase domain-containing protein n=1 Tax=Actinacidiphila yanglinensis TaxID=310779 RepID=A0A1H6E966_9ACTN|nr:class I SAM-dependent methyltransferase [Actinacidiphila yanglinensis]SEG94247.1 Methyltransferase domain-containing protein [Actinacidiphila yanglinensis]